MAGALRNLAQAKERLPEGPAIEGYHVEGPHIASEDGPRGAHPKRWVRPPDFEEFKEQAERMFLLQRLEENEWNVKHTAEVLGMQRSNLYKKIERYDLK